MFLGEETAAEVKTYFNVGFYRNALNTLNTFEIAVNNFGKRLQMHAAFTQIFTGGNSINRIAFQSIVGHSIKALATQKNGFQSPIVYIKKLLAAANLKYIGLSAATNMAIRENINGKISPNIYANFPQQSGAVRIKDLLPLARKLESELIMLRFPAPHNLIQLLDKLVQSGNTNFVSFVSADDDTRPQLNMIKFNATTWIKLTSLLKNYTQLKKTIRLLRLALRKEIDAAQLATQVQEETLRKESEGLISREQAEKEALLREQQIKSEKEATYLENTAQLNQTSAEITELKQMLLIALQELQAQKEVTGMTIEIAEKEQQINNAFLEVNNLETDLSVQADTLVQAIESPGLTIDTAGIKTLQSEVSKVAVSTGAKPANVLPILLTVGAALFMGA